MSRTVTITTTAVTTSSPDISIRRTLTASSYSTISPPPLPAFSLPLLLTFPLRVLLATCLTCLYLLHVHTALSLLSFLLSFLFFTLTSAPATGHPNTIEHLIHLLPTLHHPTTALTPHNTPPTLPPTCSVSLRFTLYDYHCHVHHWLYCLFFYTVSWLLFVVSLHPLVSSASSDSGGGSGSGRWWYDVLAGWCLGGVCQGLKYDDWSHVLWRREAEQHTLIADCDAVDDELQ